MKSRSGKIASAKGLASFGKDNMVSNKGAGWVANTKENPSQSQKTFSVATRSNVSIGDKAHANANNLINKRRR